MRSRLIGRVLVVAMFVAAVGTTQSATMSTDPAVWLATGTTVTKVSARSLATVQSTSLADKVLAVSTDAAGETTWALAASTLYRFDSQLSVDQSTDLSAVAKSASGQAGNFSQAVGMALDPYNGNVWVAGNKSVLLLDNSGELLASYANPDPIQDIAMSQDQAAWVLTSKNLIRLNGLGVATNSVSIQKVVNAPRKLIVDSLGQQLWVAGEQDLYRIDLTNLANPPVSVSLPQPSGGEIQALALDPISGMLWIADEKGIRELDRTGNQLLRVNSKDIGLNQIDSLVFEPRTRTLFVAGEQELVRLDPAAGTVLGTAAIDNGSSSGLGVVPMTIRPVLSLVTPLGGSYTNNPQAPFQLGLAADCNIPGCDSLDAYLASLRFVATLDGNGIGTDFTRTGSTAKYVPSAKLDDGKHVYDATATDAFDHASNSVSSSFFVDTIPPKITDLNPADGATVATPQISIQGTIVDASPTTVIVQDASGNAIGTSSDTDFSIGATLVAGLNAFTLTARDAAGNETTEQLHVTLSSLHIKINQPTAGASLDTEMVVVSGDYDGPVDAGIMVNGVVAYGANHQFEALVPLEAGSNTITATISTVDGKQATDSVTVNRVASVDTGGFDVSIDSTPMAEANTIRTIAGSGASGFSPDGAIATAAAFPWGMHVIAVGPDRTVYFVDRSNYVRMIGPDGKLAAFAGTPTGGYGGDGGPAKLAQLRYVTALAAGPDGSVYVGDSGNYDIRRIDPNGIISTIAGNGTRGFSGDGGPAVDAQITGVGGLGVAADGSIYFTDFQNNRIRKIAPDGTISTIAGTGYAGFFGDGGPAADAMLDFPMQLAVAPDGSIYFVDAGDSSLRKIAPDGTISSVFFNYSDPADAVAVRSDGLVLFSTYYRIYALKGDGTTARYAGTGVAGFSGDGGLAIDAKVQVVQGIAAGPDKTVVFDDSGNRRIREIDPPAPGVIPQDTTITVTSSGDNTIQKIEVDFNGDGVYDYTTTDPNAPIEHFFSQPGTYVVTIRVTDTNGKTYTFQKQVTVDDQVTKNDMLQSIYAAMLNRLRAGDIDGAAQYFNHSGAKKYRPVFVALSDHLPGIANDIAVIKPTLIADDYAEYALARSDNGKTMIYFVYFLRSADGVWRIDSL